ncbi:MAG: RdgB/HAM1 family non-canonical purine NTP pyrophosphatase [Flavobacteriales bacterium]|jgi:XTP/dITP diphosphohydrolase|nr:RdgB/HAM1 family non-canonical purine NTP pyrophosphatase [Flavobacteriales bacterium]MBT3963447.1 RdgB/HAM1 family non-canonical purine NTP pyrophosphatase [Flavobacteriales bacterium]MBT4704442.1 RdgB/HAM1 family non-canonical purine NTP pyrophosphatase [Flavobacteriales bacterium]MBT4931197.1 RdgB/HAM1 family non-canonical purine NTP pyrophosphatase [Flavobacteriales bacterium]MBT5132026.1 RdgB/HAM1 family non-canonical purine NTP pyrophosphatase [Flavobacteriales bacterium]
MEIIFASGNKHKVSEINQKCPSSIQIKSMREVGFTDDIEEYGTTLDENAKIKADFINNLYNQPCFADDTGLEIEALDGAPGVYSARYAGENCSYDDNCNKVLRSLDAEQNRKAQFRTVIHLILDGQHHQFEGVVQGVITTDKRGASGFGYDPIFLPNGSSKTFAEMPMELKNEISHRALAVAQLIRFLEGLD